MYFVLFYTFFGLYLDIKCEVLSGISNSYSNKSFSLNVEESKTVFCKNGYKIKDEDSISKELICTQNKRSNDLLPTAEIQTLKPQTRN